MHRILMLACALAGLVAAAALVTLVGCSSSSSSTSTEAPAASSAAAASSTASARPVRHSASRPVNCPRECRRMAQAARSAASAIKPMTIMVTVWGKLP